jgi:hypothetical protein
MGSFLRPRATSWQSDGVATNPITSRETPAQEARTSSRHPQVRGKPEIKAERLEIDRAALLPLPVNTFEARRVVQVSANSLSLVRFDRNDYSVPTQYAHHDVTAVGGVDEVHIVVGTEVVARHQRCWAKEQTTYDPRHYLALLERKPGALDVARPLEGWDLPACFALLRRRLEADLASAGTREFIKGVCCIGGGVCPAIRVTA